MIIKAPILDFLKSGISKLEKLSEGILKRLDAVEKDILWLKQQQSFFSRSVITGTSSAVNLSSTASGLISGSLTTSSTIKTALASYLANAYRSVEILIQISGSGSYHLTKILLIHDGINVHITEYGTITSGDYLADFSADITNENLTIYVVPASAEITSFKFQSILITL
jgi:hypothetical protein